MQMLSGFLTTFAFSTLMGCYTQLATGGYASGNSAQAVRAVEADTLAPENGVPAVLVKDYYSRPWGWDHPQYAHRPDAFHRHHGHSGHPSYRPQPGTPPKPSGPYQSAERLFNPDPSYASVPAYALHRCSAGAGILLGGALSLDAAYSFSFWELEGDGLYLENREHRGMLSFAYRY